MQTGIILLLAALASLNNYSNVAVADETVQVQDPQPPKFPQLGTAARHLKGTHETMKTEVADEEERAITQLASKFKSILGRNPSNKEIEKARSLVKSADDSDIPFDLDYIYGAFLIALLAVGFVPVVGGGPTN